MENKYFITQTEHENTVFYGITLKSDSGEYRADEITTDRDSAQKLCSLLESGKVTEVTFYDIIQDFME